MIEIESIINSTVEKVWNAYNSPEDIMNWNFASDDWHCPNATNELIVGGKLISTMGAKDGSFQFDFMAVYNEIVPYHFIHYVIEDGRNVEIKFLDKGKQTQLNIRFEPENQNSIEMQEAGWQAILNNFKEYVETK